LCQRIEARYGIHLGDYKPEQMSRRIASLARHVGSTSFLAYVSLLERDGKALEAFFDLMTINVTELFRNTSLFEDLAKKILPKIPPPTLAVPFSVWSAGCSYGAEAYTLAIILSEAFGDKPFRIRGTDIDLVMLAKANMPSFTAADMAGVSAERRETYFSSPDDKNYVPKLQIRRNVQFARHDLLSDAYPKAQYDLILCRNVVIYFNDDAKERIYAGFTEALKPGGVLFVGGTERIATAQKLGLEIVQPFFYQKPVRPSIFLKAA
jgi:chemotaxis protein methyltransferase CheR